MALVNAVVNPATGASTVVLPDGTRYTREHVYNIDDAYLTYMYSSGVPYLILDTTGDDPDPPGDPLPGGPSTAADVSLAAISGMTADNVQEGVAELKGETDTLDTAVATKASTAALDAHTTEDVGAHPASAVAFTPQGSISSANVQAAIQEVRDEAGASGGSSATLDGISNPGGNIDLVPGNANLSIVSDDTANTITLTPSSPSYTSDKIAKSIPLHSVGSNQVWTDMPAAKTEVRGVDAFRVRADLTKALQVRLVAFVKVAGSTNAELRVEYSTDSTLTFGSPAYLDGGTGPSVNIATTGLRVSSWVTLAAGAQADVNLRLVGINGDGVADPSLGNAFLQVREAGVTQVNRFQAFEGPLDMALPWTSDPTHRMLMAGTLREVHATLTNPSSSGSVVVEVRKITNSAPTYTDTLITTITIPQDSAGTQVTGLSSAMTMNDRHRYVITSAHSSATDLKIGYVIET